MIRVLHVVNWLQPGGVETQLLRILRGYDRSRFHMDVCVVGPDEGILAAEARRYDARIFTCRKTPDLWTFSRRFAALCVGKGYDVVHSHFETWSGALLRGACHAGVPVRIAQFHSNTPWPNEESDPLWLDAARALVLRWGRYWVCRYATHILAVSEAVWQERHVRCGPGGPASLVWTGGVDTDVFRPAGRDMPGKDGDPTVIWVGALREVKRVDLGIRIFQDVRDTIPTARLLIVGSGRQESELKDLSGSLGLGDSVAFLGLRHDVSDLLRSSCVFLSCSEAEGLPTVLLEAQAAGVPVVARDIPPHSEALCPELHPYLFPVNDPGRAVAAIAEILGNRELRARLANAGREFVVERYRACAQLERLQEWYAAWTAPSR